MKVLVLGFCLSDHGDDVRSRVITAILCALALLPFLKFLCLLFSSVLKVLGVGFVFPIACDDGQSRRSPDSSVPFVFLWPARRGGCP
jgi:hypothetical protein